MGFIIKDIALRYRHPVTYPDTVRFPFLPTSSLPLLRAFSLPLPPVQPLEVRIYLM